MGCPTGEKSVRLLQSEGVAADRIIVGHMDENLVSFEPGLAHLDYHRRVADLGVYSTAAAAMEHAEGRQRPQAGWTRVAFVGAAQR